MMSDEVLNFDETGHDLPECLEENGAMYVVPKTSKKGIFPIILNSEKPPHSGENPYFHSVVGYRHLDIPVTAVFESRWASG